MKRIFLFLISICLTVSVKAHPLAIEFWEMIDQAKMIVIANSLRYADGKDALIIENYEMNVLTVLRGKPITGTINVKRAKGAAYFTKDGPFVAFINQSNGFEWYGLPIDTNTKEITDHTILSLAGFYDFNAYLVSPSTITLGQLKQYLKEKKYTTSITGNLYCFSNTTKNLEPTSVQFNVDYTYTKNGINSKSSVTGLTWKGFPMEPEIQVSAWDNEVDLNFETNGYRAFTVTGEMMPVPDSTGKIRARFWITDPQELNFEELQEYLLNDIHGFPSYELEVVTDKNETYQLMLGEEMGRIGVFSYEGKKLGISSYNIDPYWPREIVMEYGYYEKLVISLDTTAITKDQLEFTHEKMVRELKVNPITGKIWIRDSKDQNKFVANCTLRYVATRFTKNVNYGKK